MTSTQTRGAGGRFAAFRHRPFAIYWTARLMTTFGTQVLSVAVLWQMYDLTRSTFYLGLVGLVQFAPALLLVLVTGAASDRFGRRLVMGLSIVLAAICAAAMLTVSASGLNSPNLVLLILTVFGVARAFLGPASASLVINLVPREDFANAVTWNSSAWQMATILGPVAGGLIYGLGETPSAPAVFHGAGAEAAYGTALACMIVGAAMIFSLPKPPERVKGEARSLDSLLAGFRFIWGEKVVLGAISLDLFAVLMGGVVALLPVYARDILQLGPDGLGLLRAAPGIGAIAMAALIAMAPIRDHAGRIMFAAVAAFGVFTVVFAVSDIFWLSIGALILLGAADMVSVVIRETLLQLWTPDSVRGRVNAVNSVFVGASNELGEFRAGTLAGLIGPAAAGAVPAAVIGGVGAILVAGGWALMFPQLRRIRSLDEEGPDAARDRMVGGPSAGPAGKP
ncbi:MFS transporter [bacterium]|nr:MFS transporter [bacterium]